eukprot:scaffold88906_cov30-Tisochrysis_lutea.AAC.9
MGGRDWKSRPQPDAEDLKHEGGKRQRKLGSGDKAEGWGGSQHLPLVMHEGREAMLARAQRSSRPLSF